MERAYSANLEVPFKAATLFGLRIRSAVPGDGEAIARIHRDSAVYYVGLAPELFRMPDDDGLVGFAEPGPDDNSADTWGGSPVSLPFWEERMRYESRSIRLRKRLSS
jgi:hypothetical protein